MKKMVMPMAFVEWLCGSSKPGLVELFEYKFFLNNIKKPKME